MSLNRNRIVKVERFQGQNGSIAICDDYQFLLQGMMRRENVIGRKFMEISTHGDIGLNKVKNITK
jgi:hypothetical protein